MEKRFITLGPVFLIGILMQNTLKIKQLPDTPETRNELIQIIRMDKSYRKG